ncbi:asparagine synthase (glutamine-hydrolyzing) [Methanococcoides methylutens]|uniref:Putative asparagine synthetase [glutamine-hydrolyzing] n=1 Tax=Methanococcoides methylutens MM1 TaxID=1434104 RepID=A0A0E3STR7_METMT|nr:asparagine synthase (glutamine-hydrolyzing) [Methanococcoides methylutens]AKB86162.1 Asparagine synthetase (glutamine-hydrolyzing) [Methanococcoides methylutens MM1]
MCGIVGFNWCDKSLVCQMMESIKNRGPDAEGFYVKDNISFGHQRLSIIDLSENGNQPLTNEDGSIIIIFNGEIYNFNELKHKLQKKHKFKSNTDSEVIVHAYEEYGEDCVKLFNGMFAFAIYDKNKEILFLARDRLGVKPLFYYFLNGKFIFASEIKAIKKSSVQLTIDDTAIYDYFTYRYVPTPKTIFNEIKKLDAATYIVFDLKEKHLKEQKYWSLNVSESTYDEKEVLNTLESLIKDCINIRLISDVPIGLFLSAGLDSSTIFHFLKDNTEINLLHVATNTNEVKLVRRLSYNKAHILEVDSTKEFDEIFKYFDEPFADSSAIPTNLISNAANDNNIKVILTGDGGDELFAGYRHYSQFFTVKKIQKILPKQFKKRLRSLSFKVRISVLSKGFFVLSSNDDLEIYTKLLGGFTRDEKKMIFSKPFLEKLENYDDYWYFRKYWNDQVPLIKNLQILDINTFLKDDILVKVDRMSMKNSVEVRSPFLDYRLFEFILSTKTGIFFKNDTLKYILKLMMRDRLPDYILNMKKKGFGYPIKKVDAQNHPSNLIIDKEYIIRNKKNAFIIGLNCDDYAQKNKKNNLGSKK